MTQSDPDKAKTRSINNVPFWQFLLLIPLSLLIRLWCKTLRIEADEAAIEASRFNKSNALVLFWHNRLFVGPEVKNRFRPQTKQCGMISASKDGALLAALYKFLNITPVRGSSSFRGDRALRSAIKMLKDGYDIGITPDGPRGPCYSFKEGPAKIAEYTKCGIIFFSTTFHRAKRVKSWDGFFIPMPFSKVSVSGSAYENLDAFLKAQNGKAEDATALLREELLRLTEDEPADS